MGEVKGYAGIEREIIELILQRKYFYGHFLQQFKRHNVDGKTSIEGRIVTTCAVSITEDLKPNLYVNTSFYNSGDYDPDHPQAQTWGMTQDEKIAVLEHEILHMLNKHLIRIEGRDDYVWNLAGDLAINQYIKNLPSGAMCPDCNIFVRMRPGNRFPSNCPVCKVALDPEKNIFQTLNIQKLEVGAETIKFEANQPTEHYYDIIWKKMPKKVLMIGGGISNQRQKGAKGGMGQGQGQQQGQGQDQQGQGDAGGKQQKDPGNGVGSVTIDGQKVPLPMDNHEVWATGADNKEMAHEKVKDMVSKAMHKVNEKSQGTMPDYVRGLVEMVLAHKTVNWKSELRKFVGYEEFAAFISSRKRLNRRFPLVQPGYIVQRKAHFLVATDSSGSIGDDEFGMFWKEVSIVHAAKVAITYVECDADIQVVEEYKRTPKKKVERVGYGGTDFRPVFELAKNKQYKNGRNQVFKIKKKVDGIIYLTDGMGTYPKEKDIVCPVIWVMTPNHSDYGWNEKLGKKIIMKK